MSSLLYKKRISKSLDAMDADKLKQAWLILKEIGAEKNISVTASKKKIDHQLAKGIRQLDNGEGTNFTSFLAGVKKKYSNG